MPTEIASPMAYHRLSRDPRLRRNRYKPWKPAVEIAVVLFSSFVLQFVFIIGFFFSGISLGFDPYDFVDRILNVELDTDPLTMLLTYGPLAITSVAAVIAAVAAGRKPGALLSVTGRLRWRTMGLALCFITVPAAACYGIDAVVNGGVIVPADRTFWTSLLILVTLIPLQCTAEELIYRGSLPQAIGAWTRSPWLAFGIALPLFVFGHTYGLAGLTSVAVYAILASVAVYLTGGLEVAIILHCTNNMVVSYSEFSGISSLGYDSVRGFVPDVAIFLQYIGALVLLAVLYKDRVSTKRPSTSWFGGNGWYQGWPTVIRF